VRQIGRFWNQDLSTVTVESYLFRMLFCDDLHRSTHGEKGTYKSPVSEDRDIGQDANCTRDLAACAERKNADPNSNDPDGRQQPHARQKTRKIWHVVGVRKDTAGRANERSDACCDVDWRRCWSPLLREPSAEQYLNDGGCNQNSDNAASEHNSGSLCEGHPLCCKISR